MAQLLIQTKNHWMDEVPPIVKLTWTQDQLDEYNARNVRGDIVVVKDDNHIWGDSEGLPDYIVVKVVGVTEQDAKKYENVQESGGKILRSRQYKIPESVVNQIMLTAGYGEFSSLLAFENIVIDKSE